MQLPGPGGSSTQTFPPWARYPLVDDVDRGCDLHQVSCGGRQFPGKAVDHRTAVKKRVVAELDRLKRFAKYGEASRRAHLRVSGGHHSSAMGVLMSSSSDLRVRR